MNAASTKLFLNKAVYVLYCIQNTCIMKKIKGNKKSNFPKMYPISANKLTLTKQFYSNPY